MYGIFRSVHVLKFYIVIFIILIYLRKRILSGFRLTKLYRRNELVFQERNDSHSEENFSDISIIIYSRKKLNFSDSLRSIYNKAGVKYFEIHFIFGGNFGFEIIVNEMYKWKCER